MHCVARRAASESPGVPATSDAQTENRYAQALGETAAAQGHKQEAQDAVRRAADTVSQPGPLRAKYIGLQAMLAHIQ